MTGKELRNLQESYMEMYNPERIDEGLRILPRERMSNKAASKRLKAVGTKLKSKFTTAKETTARNVEDEKSKKLVSQANKIDKVAAKHIPSDVEAKERKNRGGSWNPRNPMGSNEYAERQFAKNRAKLGIKEQTDLYDIILSHLLDEGYAETVEAAEVIMVNMSEEWIDSIVDEIITEGEKPFPYEKVTAQQKKHTAAGRYGNMMKMGLAKRRAKEADKRGGSQQDAGKGWYHGK